MHKRGLRMHKRINNAQTMALKIGLVLYRETESHPIHTSYQEDGEGGMHKR